MILCLSEQMELFICVYVSQSSAQFIIQKLPILKEPDKHFVLTFSIHSNPECSFVGAELIDGILSTLVSFCLFGVIV